MLGDPVSQDDTYFRTKDWERYAATDGGQQLLTDTGGNDTVSFAARADDLTIELAPGAANALGPFALQFGSDTLIENATGGDGNDRLLGNAAANRLLGMRDEDELALARTATTR